MNETDELVSLTGVVETITYRNEENGFTVLAFSCEDGEIITATGCAGDIYIGEKITFTGRWMTHPIYGKQIKFESFVRSVPETAAEMLAFLSSGIVKGVREKTAQKIIEAFGENSFEIIENDPLRLSSIPGISVSKAKDISRAFGKLAEQRNTLIALERYGISTNEALRIFNMFGTKSAEMIENNPYFLCNLGIGIDFDRTLTIASALPSRPKDEFRIQEGIIYVMKHNLNNGHTCVPRDSLFAPCRSLLECTEDTIDICLDNLIDQRRLVQDEVHGRDFIFLPNIYESEKEAARMLLFIKQCAAKIPGDIDSAINNAELIGGILYNNQQRLAIRYAVEKGILILTGGPGTGKTTTLRGILRVFENQGLEVALAAPTGRAAKRMSELTGKEAMTIHRLLEVEWDETDHTRFKRNRKNPLSAKAVIIDELSMVDIQLFSSLLDAIPIGCRLIMVGDSDQLPPVGAGNVLHDMIDSHTIPVVELKEVFRQAMESMIITNAHRIVEGQMPELEHRDRDFFFLDRRLPSAAVSTICELCETRLPKAYGFSPSEDIQVLCPSKKGETGTVSLNKILQAKINPPSKRKYERAFGSRIFRVGDKVMQTRNNYEIEWDDGEKKGQGVFNGDIGVLEEINEQDMTFHIRYDDRLAVIPFEDSKDIEHAYAVTVHKSQGNEFPCVVIPVTGITSMLCYRNLLYTAVTRAREIIVLVGDRDVVETMVVNNRKQKRYSALQNFLVLGD